MVNKCQNMSKSVKKVGRNEQNSRKISQKHWKSLKAAKISLLCQQDKCNNTFITQLGKCFNDCTDNKIHVPYGTNSPGQTICYRTSRPGLEQGFGEIESCAPQLTQTAFAALQLPYTIFGLGLAPNFLDYMYVHVTNATASSRGHTWSQVW